MIAVDTNLLVYAHREDSSFYEAAYSCILELAEGHASWAIPWPCIHEFLAIVTHPRIYAPPTPLEKAIDQVEAWIESPRLSCFRNPKITGPNSEACFKKDAFQAHRSTMPGLQLCAGPMV